MGPIARKRVEASEKKSEGEVRQLQMDVGSFQMSLFNVVFYVIVLYV